MIAVIEYGGKQFKVEVGSIIDIDWMGSETLPQDTQSVDFDKVLVLADDNDTTLGYPYIQDAVVQGDILDPLFKDKKIIVFKFKRKTGYKVKQGHRQKYTRVKITKISQN